VKRVAVISDTHLPRGRRRIPDACVERLRAADLVLHAGDFTGVEVLELLDALGTPWHGVLGNVDESAVHDRLGGREELELDVEDVRIGMVHDAGPAAGRLARLHRRFPSCDLIVFGHSHIPLHEHDVLGDVQILNPGSPTDRRRQPRHTMAEALVDGQDLGIELIPLG
jgi:hypothetical protein